MGRRPGRPAAAAPVLDAEAITAAGLALLDEEGERAVSLRGVARRLGVTPMAVAHHAGTRDDLLARVVAAAHRGLAVPEGPADAAAVAEVVLAYAAAARRHPAAVAALFARPDLLPPSLARLSDWLREQVARHDPARAEEGLALLVDYVHGHLLAAGARPRDKDADEAMERVLRANVVRLARWLMGK